MCSLLSPMIAAMRSLKSSVVSTGRFIWGSEQSNCVQARILHNRVTGRKRHVTVVLN
jgi:hypothetical protein